MPAVRHVEASKRSGPRNRRRRARSAAGRDRSGTSARSAACRGRTRCRSRSRRQRRVARQPAEGAEQRQDEASDDREHGDEDRERDARQDERRRCPASTGVSKSAAANSATRSAEDHDPDGRELQPERDARREELEASRAGSARCVGGRREASDCSAPPRCTVVLGSLLSRSGVDRQVRAVPLLRSVVSVPSACISSTISGPRRRSRRVELASSCRRRPPAARRTAGRRRS